MKFLIMMLYCIAMALFSAFVIIPYLPDNLIWMVIYLEGYIGCSIQDTLSEFY